MAAQAESAREKLRTGAKRPAALCAQRRRPARQLAALRLARFRYVLFTRFAHEHAASSWRLCSLFRASDDEGRNLARSVGAGAGWSVDVAGARRGPAMRFSALGMAPVAFAISDAFWICRAGEPRRLDDMLRAVVVGDWRVGPRIQRAARFRGAARFYLAAGHREAGPASGFEMRAGAASSSRDLVEGRDTLQVQAWASGVRRRHSRLCGQPPRMALNVSERSACRVPGCPAPRSMPGARQAPQCCPTCRLLARSRRLPKRSRAW